MHSLVHSHKDWVNTKGELVGCVQAPPLTRGREAGMWRPALEGEGQFQPQRPASSTKLWAGFQLLTSSWGPVWLTSARRAAAWDLLPRGDTRHTRDGVQHTRETKRWGLGILRHMAHLGQLTCQAAGRLSCSDLGRAQNACQTEYVPLWSIWEPEPPWLRAGKCTKHRAHFGQCSCRAPWSLSRVDLESTCHKCGPYTVSTPHTRQRYLFAMLLPPHNTTEQVSLNKWPPLPPCVRAEIRHLRDLQTEEAKLRRGNHSGSDRCNRLKPCS